jgi:hypothetical protein
MTSHPPRPSKSRNGSLPQHDPLKNIRIRVTVTGPHGKELLQRASEKGLTLEDEGGARFILISGARPEDALEQLRLLTGVLGTKP